MLIMSSSPCVPSVKAHTGPRQMQASDLDAVLDLQQRCYAPAFHEPREAFASKLLASPRSCWVMPGPSGLHAYLVSLPIEGDQLPKLHAGAWHHPAHPDWLYVHDMAVAPAARGSGASGLLMQQAYAFARALILPDIGLIAVQDSSPYWARQGFVLVNSSARLTPDKLASFGTHAVFMQRATPAA